MSNKNYNLKKLASEFGEAFNCGNLDKVMNLMTDNPCFQTSSGDSICGNKIIGQSNVRAAFEQTLDTMPDAHWKTLALFVEGDTVISHWIFTGTNRNDNKKTQVEGCDIMTYQNGKLAVKNAFRKDRPVF